jgi:hypothetical protein
VHPNQLAALEAHRPGIRELRQCALPYCRQPATKRSAYCRMHGGANGIASKPSPRRKAIREAKRELKKLLVPADLERQEIWQRHHRSCDAPARLILLRAWQSAEAEAWPRAVLDVEERYARPKV